MNNIETKIDMAVFVLFCIFQNYNISKLQAIYCFKIPANDHLKVQLSLSNVDRYNVTIFISNSWF